MSTRIRTRLKTHIFFIRNRVDRVLNHCVERFKKDTVSVTGFTGFVWTKGRFEWKRCGFKNTRIRVDGAWRAERLFIEKVSRIWKSSWKWIKRKTHTYCKCVKSKTVENVSKWKQWPTKIAGKRENSEKNANKSVIVKAVAGETF